MTVEEKIHVFENSRLVSDNFTTEAVTAAYVEALAALRSRQERTNEPMTLDELRQMARDGGYVWCADTDGMHPGLLCYVECALDYGKEAHIWLLDNEGSAGRYNVGRMIECGAIFYRRKPEQEVQGSD